MCQELIVINYNNYYKQFRMISRHSPVRQLIPTPNEIIKQKLYKIDDKYCPPFIDLAFGARVMATKNLATQVGIYNGATGTVVGFGFHKAVPEEHFQIIDTFHTLKGREIPIVLVKWINILVHNYLLI